jgi:prefoldin alpha subunit|tara:strand:+ start:224 stop:607 length:384 start_codon:yes stop_codon:yes gene_type:complete
LQEQLKHDLNTCSDSLQKLQQAVRKYHSSGLACDALNEEEVGTPMLVPVTEGLYVPGKVGATDKVLVDIGTGYFVEKTPKGAEDYCKKKVLEMQANMEKIMGVARMKQKQLVMVSEQLNARESGQQQ